MSYFDLIFQDLLIEILLRLDVKTLMRCVCVCKLWASIIRSRSFINSYESRSSVREQCILFTFCDAMTYATVQCTRPSCVNGLMYYRGVDKLLIYNPMVGKFIPLPKTNPNKSVLTWYLGYDPTNNQYKVLSFSKSNFINHPNRVDQLDVFTLGDEGSWKMIKDMNVEYPFTNGVCIRGVLYYSAQTSNGPKIMRFDVKTEKFGGFVEIPLELVYMYGQNYTLMNSQGKLALLATKGRSCRQYDLWFLEDVEKQEWSKVFINLTWKICKFNIVDSTVAGFIRRTGEIIVIARDLYGHLHVIYVDLKKNCSREVKFQGNRTSYAGVVVFSDYVESLMFL